MADNNFKGTVEALFHGMDGVVSSKTVVGDAIHIGDTIILPLVDVSFAVGAGAFNADKKEKGAVPKGTAPVRLLVVLALSCCFRLLFTSYARLLIMLSFTNLLLNTCLCAVSFESA